jgi:hypothetical protein
MTTRQRATGVAVRPTPTRSIIIPVAGQPAGLMQNRSFGSALFATTTTQGLPHRPGCCLVIEVGPWPSAGEWRCAVKQAESWYVLRVKKFSIYKILMCVILGAWW